MTIQRIQVYIKRNLAQTNETELKFYLSIISIITNNKTLLAL